MDSRKPIQLVDPDTLKSNWFFPITDTQKIMLSNILDSFNPSELAMAGVKLELPELQTIVSMGFFNDKHRDDLNKLRKMYINKLNKI